LPGVGEEKRVILAKRDGKVGNLSFGFPLFRPASPELWKCGNLAAFCEISKGLVESVGSLLLAFHAFHSPAISTTPPYFKGRMAAISKCSDS